MEALTAGKHKANPFVGARGWVCQDYFLNGLRQVQPSFQREQP